MGGYEPIFIQPILNIELSKDFVRYHKQKKFVTNKNPNLIVMSKTVLLRITSRFTRR